MTKCLIPFAFASMILGLLLMVPAETSSLQPANIINVKNAYDKRRIFNFGRRIRGGSAQTSRPLADTAYVANVDSASTTFKTLETNTIPTDTSMINNPRVRTGEWVSSAWWTNIVPSRDMVPELIAETFGTFLLLQLAIGIVFSAVFKGSMEGVFPIAVLTGTAITAACAAVGNRCAAHFNPAITFAMCLYRKFGWYKLVPYSVAQLLGATGATAMNYAMYASTIRHYELSNGIIRASLGGLQSAKAMACYFSDPVTPLNAFISEIFGTFALTSVVFALTSDKNKQALGLFIPPIIGGAVALIISIVGPISCASLNPARELGPRIILKLCGWDFAATHQLGLYLAAPIIGAALGGIFVDKFLYADHFEDPAKKMMEMKVE